MQNKIKSKETNKIKHSKTTCYVRNLHSKEGGIKGGQTC